MTISAAILLLAPTFSQASSLPAAASGDLVLAGQDHAPIETVEPPVTRALMPPGNEEMQLVEGPRRESSGCVRKRWTAHFSPPQAATDADATLSGVYGSVEVALASAAGCPGGTYTQLNSKITAEAAFGTLRRLDRIRFGPAPVRLICKDSTGSDLCGSEANTRQALAKVSPWALSRDGDTFVFWLGTPGQIVTEVRMSADPAAPVAVSRSVPPPA